MPTVRLSDLAHREPAAGPALAAPRVVVDELGATTHQVGELMLEVAPAYLSDTAASDVLAPLCRFTACGAL
ncbi:hypothetical protein ACFVY0_40210 [Streptomyces sp. NPDC058286]|uniref:hypothetical protein n=1 Tax=Streptomyces sp. NPDC058286 TaxID=3346422 RepID=UPI0036E845F9